MDSGTNAKRHSSGVNDEISDLSEEVILVSEPVNSSISVRISIDECHSLESSSSLDCGKSHSITDKLGVVILDDWRANSIGTRWEID